MNLDKLKELEAKATPGPWTQVDRYNIDDINIALALRNQAKEMIETIERYKAALEKAQKDLDEAMDYHTIESRAELLGDAIDDITLALKDPEKNRRNSYPLGAQLPHLKGETHD